MITQMRLHADGFIGSEENGGHYWLVRFSYQGKEYLGSIVQLPYGRARLKYIREAAENGLRKDVTFSLPCKAVDEIQNSLTEFINTLKPAI